MFIKKRFQIVRNRRKPLKKKSNAEKLEGPHVSQADMVLELSEIQLVFVN